MLRYDEATCCVVWRVVKWYCVVWCHEMLLYLVWFVENFKKSVVWFDSVCYAMIECGETGRIKDFRDCWSSSLFDPFSCLFFSVAQKFFATTHAIWFCLRLMTSMSSCQSPVHLESFWRCFLTAILVYELVSFFWWAFYTEAVLVYSDWAFWEQGLPISPGFFQDNTKWIAFLSLQNYFFRYLVEPLYQKQATKTAHKKLFHFFYMFRWHRKARGWLLLYRLQFL